MGYILDAWLERRRPQVRIWDRDSGRLVLHLDHRRLKYLSDAGLIDLVELALAGRTEATALAARLLRATRPR